MQQTLPVHPHGLGEGVPGDHPLIITQVVHLEVLHHFHAALLEEIGQAGVERVLHVDMHPTRGKQRVRRTVRKPPAPHLYAERAPHNFIVGATGPVGDAEFLLAIRGKIVVAPIDARRFAVADTAVVSSGG